MLVSSQSVGDVYLWVANFICVDKTRIWGFRPPVPPLRSGVRLDPNTCGGNLRVIWVAAPSNSPAQGLVCWQLDALRISFAMGIGLWVECVGFRCSTQLTTLSTINYQLSIIEIDRVSNEIYS